MYTCFDKLSLTAHSHTRYTNEKNCISKKSCPFLYKGKLNKNVLSFRAKSCSSHSVLQKMEEKKIYRDQKLVQRARYSEQKEAE